MQYRCSRGMTLVSYAVAVVVFLWVLFKLGLNPLSMIRARELLYQAKEEALSCLTTSDSECREYTFSRPPDGYFTTYVARQMESFRTAPLVLPSIEVPILYTKRYRYQYTGEYLSSLTVEEPLRAFGVQGPVRYVFAQRLYPHFDLGSTFFETFKLDYTFTDTPTAEEREFTNSFFWSSVAFEDFNTEGDVTSRRRLNSSLNEKTVTAITPSEKTVLSQQVNVLALPSGQRITSTGTSSLKISLGMVAGMPSRGECFLAAPEKADYSDSSADIAARATRNSRLHCSREGITPDKVPLLIQVGGKGTGKGKVVLSLKGAGSDTIEIRTGDNKIREKEGDLGGRVWETRDDSVTDATFVPRGIGLEAVRRLRSESNGEEYLWPGEEQFRTLPKRTLSEREKLTARILLNRGEELQKYALILVAPGVPLTLTISREGGVSDGTWSKGGSFNLEKVTVVTPAFTTKEVTKEAGVSSCYTRGKEGELTVRTLEGSTESISYEEYAPSKECITEYPYTIPPAGVDPRTIKVKEDTPLRTLSLTPQYPNTPYTGKGPVNAPTKRVTYPCKENSWEADDLKKVCGVPSSGAIIETATAVKELGSCQKRYEGNSLITTDPECEKKILLYPRRTETLQESFWEKEPFFHEPTDEKGVDGAPREKKESQDVTDLYKEYLTRYESEEQFPSPFNGVNWELLRTPSFKGYEAAYKDALGSVPYISFTYKESGRARFPTSYECKEELGCKEEKREEKELGKCSSPLPELCCPKGDENTPYATYSCVITSVKEKVKYPSPQYREKAYEYALLKAREKALSLLQSVFPQASFNPQSSYPVTLSLSYDKEKFRYTVEEFSIGLPLFLEQSSYKASAAPESRRVEWR